MDWLTNCRICMSCYSQLKSLGTDTEDCLHCYISSFFLLSIEIPPAFSTRQFNISKSESQVSGQIEQLRVTRSDCWQWQIGLTLVKLLTILLFLSSSKCSEMSILWMFITKAAKQFCLYWIVDKILAIKWDLYFCWCWIQHLENFIGSFISNIQRQGKWIFLDRVSLSFKELNKWATASYNSQVIFSLSNVSNLLTQVKSTKPNTLRYPYNWVFIN